MSNVKRLATAAIFSLMASSISYAQIPVTDAAAIAKMIADGKGTANIKTVAGGMLTAKSSGSSIVLTDEKRRHGQRDHCGCVPIERRDSRDRQSVDAKISETRK